MDKGEKQINSDLGSSFIDQKSNKTPGIEIQMFNVTTSPKPNGDTQNDNGAQPLSQKGSSKLLSTVIEQSLASK